MSMVRQCDRCGAVFAPYRKRVSDHEQKPTAFVGVGVGVGVFDYKTNAPVDNALTKYDLCPKCSKQLNVFLENPNITIENITIKQHLNENVKVDNETIKAGDEDDDDDVEQFVRKLIGDE